MHLKIVTLFTLTMPAYHVSSCVCVAPTRCRFSTMCGNGEAPMLLFTTKLPWIVLPTIINKTRRCVLCCEHHCMRCQQQTDHLSYMQSESGNKSGTSTKQLCTAEHSTTHQQDEQGVYAGAAIGTKYAQHSDVVQPRSHMHANSTCVLPIALPQVQRSFPCCANQSTCFIKVQCLPPVPHGVHWGSPLRTDSHTDPAVRILTIF